ncbi:hypothetical protein [Jeotgalibacillus salarius]|uniref:Multidrug ABC transporter ATPase n=1 Tax=Jeotgalibacillus salarius TaxID=546023 RepID=A0A4Y8L9J1_9BACL|nr:hypothetical protein [Jeotgalibacillus salarius]TFD97710.1 multidrug ABC transporter ATPase [Jeotgalibacillus salarius]
MPGREYFKKLEPVNGSMASNMEELVMLGKQMEKIRSGGELKSSKKLSDPIQYEEKS